MAEPLPNEDQDPAAGFQSSETGEGVMTLLARAGTAMQPGDADTPFIVTGTATDGGTDHLIDDTQDWSIEQWTGRLLGLERDGVVTRHTILGNVESVLGFAPPLGASVEATATIGSGEGPPGEGQITVTLVEKGADGDNWVLHLISEAAGVAGTMTNVVGADVQNKIISVFIDTNGLGEQQQLWAGSLAELFSQNIPSHISAPNEGFISGTMPLGTVAEPVVVTFAGGVDGPRVGAGDRYWVLDVPLAPSGGSGGSGDAAILRHAWTSPYSYCGRAPADSAESAEVWTITRLTIAADGSVSATLTASDVAWVDRLTATYS
jgi:hypothetical protein